MYEWKVGIPGRYIIGVDVNGLLILSERHIAGMIIKFIFSNAPVVMETVVDRVIQIFVEVNQKTFWLQEKGRPGLFIPMF